jgi:CDP-diacylglycerol---glycerol-3-phosphate 3-phosphatidyltransferase
LNRTGSGWSGDGTPGGTAGSGASRRAVGSDATGGVVSGQAAGGQAAGSGASGTAPAGAAGGAAGRQGGAGAATVPALVSVQAPGVVNIANALTVLRLALVPVFVVFLLTGGTVARIVALVIFVAASITDLLDGHLARGRGLITDFGKIADPIADKALIGSALICLSFLAELPWWVTGVILFREVAVTGLRFWVIRHGVIPASRGGKAKTLLQVVAIGVYIMPGPPGLARGLLMAAALVVTLATGGDYVVRAIRLRRGTVVAAASRRERHG